MKGITKSFLVWFAFLKENPAVTSKTKVNASLIKLDSFFDKKREELVAKQAKSNDIDEDDFV